MKCRFNGFSSYTGWVADSMKYFLESTLGTLFNFEYRICRQFLLNLRDSACAQNFVCKVYSANKVMSMHQFSWPSQTAIYFAFIL